MLATYKKAGETLTLRALRFEDLSGAYGAYTVLSRHGLAQGRHRDGRGVEP